MNHGPDPTDFVRRILKMAQYVCAYALGTERLELETFLREQVVQVALAQAQKWPSNEERAKFGGPFPNPGTPPEAHPDFYRRQMQERQNHALGKYPMSSAGQES